MDFFTFKEKLSDRPTPPAPTGKDILSVSQITSQIERALQKAFPSTVHVRGEVSNYKSHSVSGHLYFTLKDPHACIECVMYRSDAARLKFVPADGLELLASGKIAVYGPRGRYQLAVSRLEPLGQGALELAFRQLCAKLEDEGLFATDRKKAIPLYPQRIVLVTSTETAAVKDMFKVLRRFPWLNVCVYHVPVQGDGAAQRIASALTELNKARSADVILLARGGGSLEDLWEFNEEIVARAIAASSIPIITGIGHEVDVSIADLVADYHAHTPTEAAQVATRHWRTAREVVDASAIRLRREMMSVIQVARQRLVHLERHEVFRRPMNRINISRQLLDDRLRTINFAISKRLRGAGERLIRLIGALRERHPRHAMALAKLRLEAMSSQHNGAIRRCLDQCQTRVTAIHARLSALAPEQVLKRGYSITTLKRSGAVVRSASQVRAGDRLLTRLADGTIESTAEDGRQLPLFE